MFDFIILYLFTTCVDILFRQITIFIKVHVAFAFGLQTLYSIDFTKIYGLMGQLKATQTFMNAVI